MVLPASFQNLDFTTVDTDTIIPIWYRDPAFGSDLDEKGVQTDIFDKDQRVPNHVNAWRQDDVLPRTFQVHDGTLIHSDNLEITKFTLDNIAAIVLIEAIDSLKWTIAE